MTQLSLPFKRSRKKPQPAPEHDEQAALIRWWAMTRWAHQGIILSAVPNGGARDPITAARLKAEGVVAGMPDLELHAARGPYHMLHIEMKRKRGGRVSPAQALVHEQLRAQGYAVVVARGWDEARAAIENYMKQGEYDEKI